MCNCNKKRNTGTRSLGFGNRTLKPAKNVTKAPTVEIQAAAPTAGMNKDRRSIEKRRRDIINKSFGK
jgi:hypothetical protein